MHHRPLIRAAFRRAWRSALERLAQPMGEEELSRPAMVFAPHPDDETIGCGGTILLKRQRNVPVRIVFLTDGGCSHMQLISREELGAIRAREAVEAAKVLGVDASCLHLLGFPDRTLSEYQEDAVVRVAALLEEHRPPQLFVPYAVGENRDHAATCAIVHEAVRRVGRPVTVFEYAIWSWRYWPHVGRPGSLIHPRTVARNVASTGRGVLRFAGFRTTVGIQEVIERKRAALAQHVSQVERRNGDPRWDTLRDVDDGEFLECFFDGFELYRRIEIGSGPTS